MKKTLIKVRNIVLHVLFLGILFVLSVMFFMRTLNQAAPDSAQSMDSSTFPLVSMVRSDTAFNCMHGYSREMDVRFLRDSITPLSADREIGVQVQTFSASVDALSYEVLSLDGSESLENTQVIKTEQEGDLLKADLKLQSQILMDREYVLKIALQSGGRTIYYYTHILLADGLHTDEYLNYVSGFYDKTINRTDLNAVGAAVEPDETTDEEQTLAYMDIHDSVPQLTWGDLQPQVYYKPTPKITEINQNTASLTMEYRIAAVNENGITEVFNVDEFYRVRFTDSRVFLLNFERTTDEVFDPENNVLEDNGIRLGITGKDVQYAVDEKSRVIAFVQENELWTFERASSKLTQVFSFPQKENMDIRDFYDGHDIRILQVTTEGNVGFIVSGYMNRGTHEGDNGVSLYWYDAATDMTEELVFISCDETGEVLRRKTDSAVYLPEDRSFFCLLLGETLYRVDLGGYTLTTLAEGIGENCYAASRSGRYFAWLAESEEYTAKSISVLDLETGESREITCGADEYVRPVCFMREDLVYGLAKQEDTEKAVLSWGFFPMYRMKIEDPEGNVVKDYQPDGCRVMDVVQSDHMLSLSRAAIGSDGTWKAASGDEIMDMAAEDNVSVGSATKITQRKQTQVYLRVGGRVDDTTPDVVRAKNVKYSAPRTVRIPAQTTLQTLYYVYASGALREIDTHPNAAVAAADAALGVVVDEALRYVWVRGFRGGSAEIPLEKVPDVMKNGVTQADQLAAAAGENERVLDLTGCTLDEVLYYVSHGMPVAALTAAGPVTIVGYDEYNTYLLNPGEAEWYYYGMNDSTQMFEDAGNQFFTILKE